MPNYLLDTTVIIDYLRGEPKIVDLVRKLFSDGSSLGCCPINIIEVYAGMKPKEKPITEQFIDNLEPYELTPNIAKRAGTYKREYQQKGITLCLPDVAIASVAVSNDLILLTDNPRHYPMPELRLQSGRERRQT